MFIILFFCHSVCLPFSLISDKLPLEFLSEPCVSYRKIEEKRGVVVTDSGIPEVKLSPAVNGLQKDAPRTSSSTVAAPIKSGSSWDEDWGTKPTGPANSVQNSISTPIQTVAGNPVSQITSSQKNLSLSGVSNQSTTKSCPSVDVEWPPRASSGVTSQFGDTERHTIAAGTSSASNLQDDDPFADWPPRPSGSLSGGSGNSNNGTLGMPLNKLGINSSTSNSSNLGFQSSNSWSVNPQNSVPVSLNPRNATSGISSLNSGGFESQNSLGFLKQSQAIPAPNVVSYNSVKSTDLGSIFASNKNEQIAPKLAPPPSTTVGGGRGRGRGRGATSAKQPSHNKSKTEQAPLMDLLG